MIPIKPKDPEAVGPFFIVWCDISSQNDGSKGDRGFLQGDEIVTSTWTVPTGIDEDSSDTASVQVGGVVYAADTVATIWLSGGTAGEVYTLTNQIETGDGRIQDQSIKIKVMEA